MTVPLHPSIDPVKLAKLAMTAVRVGLNLRKGQNLIIGAPLEAAPLVRLVIEEAYKAGAGIITTFYNDEEAALLRYKYADDSVFDKAPDWLYKGMGEALDTGEWARMGIGGANPFLLNGQDSRKIGREAKAFSIAAKPAMEPVTEFKLNWTLLAYPTVAWSKAVFPDLPEAEAVKQMAEAIFKISRVDSDDPVAAWDKHNDELHKHQDWLNKRKFAALHFKGPGTDLTVGLADDHKWVGGSKRARNGIMCNLNIPTEEVFTTPHGARVDGTVSSTKPLSYMGNVIEGIKARFEGGKIVEVSAAKNEEVFKDMIATDPSACRLGEVALVPHSSPISLSNILFFNTLFDENAACHIAQGQCYATCFENSENLSKEQVIAKGGNQSLVHVDWMIGSDEIDVDGITKDGKAVPVMRKGEWATGE